MANITTKEKVVGTRKGALLRSSQGRSAILFPNTVLWDERLTLGPKTLFLHLSYFDQMRQPVPPQSKLAELIGVTPKTLRSYLRDLVRRRLLTTSRPNRTAPIHYILHTPSTP